MLFYGDSFNLPLFTILVGYPFPRLFLKSRSAPPCSSMDGSSASTRELWMRQTMEESSSADRTSSLAPLVWVDLVSKAPNVVAGKLNSVLPPPLLVRNRRSAWLTLMVLRFGPSPCLICPPSSLLPKALKPMESFADLSPYLLRPRYFCRDQLLSLLWTLSETRLPNHSLSSFRVKSTGIMTLSLRRKYSDHVFERWLPSLFQPR
ncbi:hypothetical protein ISN44_As03g032100 [Arabidopsis suecica]|uniref:Uncharacterized protein n=1 Tax=Arabidopsis suecica TaxID=45249 RepID=A0A8T2FAE0_ARASU|nr:hypothetical protein ISN44_As03g032100 [Arabidopsis suecica]